MKVKRRTIDDLGEDVSIEYIESQEKLKGASFKDDFVGNLATVLSQSPYQAEWESFQLRFGTDRSHEPWADFLPPPGFFSAMNRLLFSYQLIPSMGIPERQEDLLDKLQRFRKKKKRAHKNTPEETEKSLSDERENDKERRTIENLFLLLKRLDEDLELVNMLRNQYHKG